MQRQYKLKVDPIDMRDKVFRSEAFVHPHHLPEEVDLRDKMSPIVNQGELGSCTANAIASGLREYLLLQSGKELTPLSRLFLYWHERQLIDTINEDSGAYIRDGLKVLSKIGVAPEADFPYDITRFTETPSTTSEADAATYKIKSYHRVTSLNALKASLAEGLPVVIGMTVYESFESYDVAKTGIVPVPKPGEQQLGGHAMCVVGYKKIDGTEYLIVRNSWGEDWGDKGYCYIPSSFVAHNIINDLWTGR